VLHAREAERVLEDEVRLGERGLRVAARVAEAVADVGAGLGAQRRQVGEVAGQRLTRVHEGRAGRQRLLERDHSRQRRVVDVDQLQRLGRRRFVDGDDRRDRVALVARDVDRQQRPVAERGPVVRFALPREIPAGEHREDAGMRAGAGGVHPPESRVRVG